MKVVVIKNWPEKKFPNAEFLLFSDHVAAKTLSVDPFRGLTIWVQSVKDMTEAFRPYAGMLRSDISTNLRKTINARRSDLALAMGKLAMQVETLCENNEQSVLDAGLTVKAKSIPKGIPPRCTDIKANKALAAAGTVAFTVKPYDGAASYRINYFKEGIEERFTTTSPSSRIHITGLESGARYYFNASYVGRGKNNIGEASTDLAISVQ